MFRTTFHSLWTNVVGVSVLCTCATSNPGSHSTNGTANPPPTTGATTSSAGAFSDGTIPNDCFVVGESSAVAPGGTVATGSGETLVGASEPRETPAVGLTTASDDSASKPSSSNEAVISCVPLPTDSGPLVTLAPEPFVFGQPPAAASRFAKGINLGNRMEAPNEGDWGGEILDSDFPFIAQRGFDHVRIPMKFSGHASTSAPYTIEDEFFARVDTVVQQALAANLAVIIDMHAYDEMATEPDSQRERFLALWSQIATRYKDQPDSVAFELMNEPHSELDDVWNDFLAKAIGTVRITNPRRLLVIDAVFWADPPRLSQLQLPDDANLLVAVHLYEPKLFSMQGKSWMGPEYMTTGLVFPGPPASPATPVEAASEASWAQQWFDDYNTLPAATNPSGPATIAAQLAYITDYQTAEGRTVYNGEWGPQDGGDMDSRVHLVEEVRKQCEQANVGWAIWEDRNNMQLFDSTAGTWVTPIVDALLPL